MQCEATDTLGVTILINNYNYARFLPAAIDSALSQTYHPLEVVVVDDGSTDESLDIIRDYGDRVRPVFKSNGGQASAFNAGFAASRGEVICLLDADDFFFRRRRNAPSRRCLPILRSAGSSIPSIARMARVTARACPRSRSLCSSISAMGRCAENCRDRRGR